MIQYIPYFIIKIIRFLFKDFIFNMHFGIGKGFKRRFGLGFKPRITLSKEERLLQALDLKGKIVYDIGGYIGIHTLFFSSAVGNKGKVITFEPNPLNYREILSNLRINKIKNVKLIPIGIGSKISKLTLSVDPRITSRGTFRFNKNKKSKKRFLRFEDIKIDSLDNQLIENELPVPDLVKVDVEGFESEVIFGMKQIILKYKPDLFIELHKEMDQNLKYFLVKENYYIYHVEMNKKIRVIDKVKNGHLFCFIKGNKIYSKG
ncbi:MAG: FkbM family methyltransferase [Candidatus Lokiarchaeota archaeon]